MIERSAAYYGFSSLGTTCVGGTQIPDPMTGLKHTETPDCNFIEFGYFANTVNNADVVKAGLPEWNTWSPAGTQAGTPSTYTTIAVITSANQMLAGNLKSAFTAAGQTSFIETVPALPLAATCPTTLTVACVNTCNGPVATSSSGPYCDVLGTVIRETLPEYQLNEAAWASLTQPNNYLPNILVYRVNYTGGQNIYSPAFVNGQIYTPGCNSNETLSTSTPTCGTSGPNFDNDLQWIATRLAAAVGPTAGVTYAMPQASSGASPGANCFIYGVNCSGATQDTDSYRSVNLGLLGEQVPTFVIGLIHSSSPASVTGTAPLNNARYTSIGISDNQSPATGFPSQNVGVAAAAEPNFSIEYIPPSSQNIPLSGSAAAVLQAFLLYNAAPSSLKNDLPNIYIHVFYRYNSGDTCAFSQICGPGGTPTWATIITTGLLSQNVAGNPVYYIPATDAVSFTERGYVLSPVSLTAPLTPSNQTGARAGFLESPYVLCDSAQTCH